jgi:hypothetical protein
MLTMQMKTNSDLIPGTATDLSSNLDLGQFLISKVERPPAVELHLIIALLQSRDI